MTATPSAISYRSVRRATNSFVADALSRDTAGTVRADDLFPTIQPVLRSNRDVLLSVDDTLAGFRSVALAGLCFCNAALAKQSNIRRLAKKIDELQLDGVDFLFAMDFKH